MDNEPGLGTDLGIKTSRDKRDRSPVRIIQRNKFEEVPEVLNVVGAACFAPEPNANALNNRGRERKKQKKIIESDVYGNEFVVVDPEAALERENQRRRELEEFGTLKYVTAVKKIKNFYTHPRSGDQIECEMFFNECCAIMALQTSCACNSKTEEGLILYSYCIEFYCGSFYWVGLNGDFMPRENAARELAFALGSVKLIHEVGCELKFRLVAKFGPSFSAIVADAADTNECEEDSFSDFEKDELENEWEDSSTISTDKGPNRTQEKEVTSIDFRAEPEAWSKSASFQGFYPKAAADSCAYVAPKLTATDTNPWMCRFTPVSLLSLGLLPLPPPPPPPPPRSSTCHESVLEVEKEPWRSSVSKDEIRETSKSDANSLTPSTALDQKNNVRELKDSGRNPVINQSKDQNIPIPPQVPAICGRIYKNMPSSDNSFRTLNLDPHHSSGAKTEVISQGNQTVAQNLPCAKTLQTDALKPSLVNYSDEDDDEDSTNENSIDEVGCNFSRSTKSSHSSRGCTYTLPSQIPFTGLMSFSKPQAILKLTDELPTPKVTLPSPLGQSSRQQPRSSYSASLSEVRRSDVPDPPFSTPTTYKQDPISLPRTALFGSGVQSFSRFNTQSSPLGYWPRSTQPANHSRNSSSHLVQPPGNYANTMDTKMTFKQFLESRNIKM